MRRGVSGTVFQAMEFIGDRDIGPVAIKIIIPASASDNEEERRGLSCRAGREGAGTGGPGVGPEAWTSRRRTP